MTKIVYSNFFLKEHSVFGGVIDTDDQCIVDQISFNAVRRQQMPIVKADMFPDLSLFVANKSESLMNSIYVE